MKNRITNADLLPSAPLAPNGLLSPAGRVLVACEYSGIVRKAFSLKGWDAWSVDILNTDMPTEFCLDENGNGWGNHIQGSALDVLNDRWDLLIAFPPCTYLTYAGMRNWYDEGRAEKRIKAADFFMKMYNAPVPLVCVENPQGIMSKIFREPDMVIHPYYFGEREMKRTCLWLRGLPKLEYHLEDNLFNVKTATDKPQPKRVELCKKTGRMKNRYFTDTIVNGKLKSGLEKSKTFQSVANAMAEQWTAFVLGSR